MGSLSAMVAVAAFAPFFSEICDARVDVMVLRVTVKDSAVSDSASSVAVMVMVCVAPAALFAAKVTVPEVADRSAASAASAARGADQATVTVGVHRLRQGDGEGGVTPLGDVGSGAGDAQLCRVRVAGYRRGGLVVVGERDDGVAHAQAVTVVVPDTMMVSSPSTTVSSVGVMVSVPVPLFELASMVMLASAVVAV